MEGWFHGLFTLFLYIYFLVFAATQLQAEVCCPSEEIQGDRRGKKKKRITLVSKVKQHGGVWVENKKPCSILPGLACVQCTVIDLFPGLRSVSSGTYQLLTWPGGRMVAYIPLLTL